MIRPGRLDVLLPALIALAGVVEIIVVGYQPRWPSVGAFLLAAGVASRARVASLVAPPLTAAIFALTPLLGGDVFQAAAWVPLLAFGCFSAGLYPSPARWAAGLACVLLAVGISVAGLAWLTDFEPGLPFGLILGVGGWALGFRLRAALDQSRRAGGSRSMGAMATYVRAGLPEVATALAALTGEPHPLAIKDPAQTPPANTGIDPGSPYSSAAFVSSRVPARRRQGTAQSYTEIVKAIDARSAEEQGCRFSS